MMINSKYKKQPPRGPKLVRRNAIKNIDYDASTSESTSPSYSSNSSTSEDRSVYKTRSLDLLPAASRTSFRVRGNDGDCDQIFRYLGFSGPEDVSIPVAAWEARKNLSPSADLKTPKFGEGSFEAGVRVSECERNHGAETVDLSLEDGAIRVDEMNGDDIESRMLLVIGDIRIENIVTPTLAPSQPTKQSAVDLDEFEGRFGSRVGVNNGEQKEQVESITDGSDVITDEFSDSGVKSESNNVGLGIRETRPPKLAPPPVAMRTVMVDNTSSTWDLYRAFGPGDQGSSSPRDVISNSNNEVREQEEVDKSNINGSIRESNQVEGKEGAVGLDWPSDSSADDGENDSVALMSENDHTISPNGSFSCNIMSWQKGDFLGSGSFGTVYEGFTDDGLFFAVKEVSLLDQGSLGQQSLYQLEQEISLLSQFQHENIVRYLGTDKDDKKLYIFLELLPKGSLARMYQKYRLRDSQVSAYTRQILSGLNYLHCRNVVHSFFLQPVLLYLIPYQEMLRISFSTACKLTQMIDLLLLNFCDIHL